MASQLGSLVTAWKERMNQCQVDWTKEEMKKLMKARKVRLNEAVSGLQGDDDEDLGLVSNPLVQDKTGGWGWWFRRFVSAKDTEIPVDDRLLYSVGRGMLVFGSVGSLDQLQREIHCVKFLVVKIVIRILESTLPVVLPYPVLLSLSMLICSSGGGSKLAFASMERASQLVESKYLNRVYLAALDVFNVIKEIMFKHAAETFPPNFPNKFAFLRSTMVRNFDLLETFLKQTVDQEPEVENIFYKELKGFKLKMEPSKLSDIVLQKRFARDSVVVSGDHTFIVHGKGH